MINKLALFINHNIFLTNDQINELYKKNYLNCLGVSIPVWVNGKNSKTTEPASEIFCEYEIFNDVNFEENIEFTKKGYKLYLPNPKWKPPKPMIDTSEMNEEERAYYERKRDRWWQKNVEPMTINSLAKTKYFRTQIKKLDQKITKINANVDIQHTLQIKTIELLTNNFA